MKRLLVGVAAAVVMMFSPIPMGETAQAKCQTKACWNRVHKERAWDWCVRERGAEYCVWKRRFKEYSRPWRTYAHAVIACEGGRGWNADGSNFILRAEWTPSTWRAAGGNFDRMPSYYEEAVRVIRWTGRVGMHTTAGWPNCP